MVARTIKMLIININIPLSAAGAAPPVTVFGLVRLAQPVVAQGSALVH